MLLYQESAYSCKHEYFFTFREEQYRIHSVVRLTEEGRRYLEMARHEVILTAVYYRLDGRKMWKYSGKDIRYNVGIRDKSTDRIPDELIETVVAPASADYASREILGTASPTYKSGVKHTKRDWEIPELRRQWIIFILIIIAAFFFKDWYVKLIIILVVSWIFGLRRQAYIDAYTTYTHDEDDEILRHKYHVLYGIKCDNANEDEQNSQNSNKMENE